MAQRLIPLFQEAFRELYPRTPMPEFSIRFFPFVNINSNIRLRDNKLHVRISDLLEGAPAAILSALAHLLLAKMYRQGADPARNRQYRRYLATHDLTQKAYLVRQMRGRKRVVSPRGHVYDLDAVFEDLNSHYFHGLMARPTLTWSQLSSRNRLGHYDPAHNTIVISRVFDHPLVPLCVLEYIVYHEMLHLKHPVHLRGSRRCVHSAEFRAEEKLFPHLTEARRFLRKL